MSALGVMERLFYHCLFCFYVTFTDLIDCGLILVHFRKCAASFTMFNIPSFFLIYFTTFFNCAVAGKKSSFIISLLQLILEGFFSLSSSSSQKWSTQRAGCGGPTQSASFRWRGYSRGRPAGWSSLWLLGEGGDPPGCLLSSSSL